MTLALIIFFVMYILLATEIVEKAIATTLGAVASVCFGAFIVSPSGEIFNWEVAAKSIELNVIFLLVGMMTCVKILSDTGFFEFISIYVAKAMKGHAALILVLMLILTMVFSALLDNVTTIILLCPVTILITQLLELPTTPFLILEALASNIGGTATLVGDPPNIIIADKASLSFVDFIVNLTPAVIVMAVVFIAIALLVLRKHLKVPQHIRARVLNSYPSEAIIDRKNMYKALTVFGLIFVGFSVHHMFHIEPGIVAVAGMAVMLLVCKSDTEHMLQSVEWDAIIFFIGLFIVIGSLEHAGAIHKLAEIMIKFCGDNKMLTCMIVLWGSAIFSALLDNIPFVIAMTPLVMKLIIEQNWWTETVYQNADGVVHWGAHPLFWALALGACLGGNGTLIGASANIVAAKVGERNGYNISFMHFMKYGFICMIITVVLATIYLKLFYF